MKHQLIFYLLIISLSSCDNKKNSTVEQPAADSSIMEPSAISAQDTLPSANTSASRSLILTSEALQVMNKETGSTIDIPFGMEIEQAVETVNNTLGEKYRARQVNLECGEGPMEITSYGNGLKLLFQTNSHKDSEGKSSKKFRGWLLDDSGVPKEITTMAGIGIGSTKA